jgi:hypothetical protein
MAGGINFASGLGPACAEAVSEISNPVVATAAVCMKLRRVREWEFDWRNDVSFFDVTYYLRIKPPKAQPITRSRSAGSRRSPDSP